MCAHYYKETQLILFLFKLTLVDDTIVELQNYNNFSSFVVVIKKKIKFFFFKILEQSTILLKIKIILNY